ncbi:hypothetical protein PMI09_02662 [Rhizobium sp. CF122]|nr:hypothetical protein PMI09_02662 [Rhizobium sp. CF122]
MIGARTLSSSILARSANMKRRMCQAPSACRRRAPAALQGHCVLTGDEGRCLLRRPAACHSRGADADRFPGSNFVGYLDGGARGWTEAGFDLEGRTVTYGGPTETARRFASEHSESLSAKDVLTVIDRQTAETLNADPVRTTISWMSAHRRSSRERIFPGRSLPRADNCSAYPTGPIAVRGNRSVSFPPTRYRTLRWCHPRSS